MAAPHDALNDSQLLRASLSDPGAFELLFARHATGVRAWLAGELRDITVANDLLAETFAQAWRSRHRFEGTEPGDGLAWIYGIARNLLRRHHKRGRVEAHARKRLGMRLALTEEDRAHEVIARLAATGLQHRIATALKGLPDRQRHAIDARVIRELDYSSVAAELSCSEPNARALVSRGLRHLSSMLTGVEP